MSGLKPSKSFALQEVCWMRHHTLPRHTVPLRRGVRGSPGNVYPKTSRALETHLRARRSRERESTHIRLLLMARALMSSTQFQQPLSGQVRTGSHSALKVRHITFCMLISQSVVCCVAQRYARRFRSDSDEHAECYPSYLARGCRATRESTLTLFVQLLDIRAKDEHCFPAGCSNELWAV